MDPITISTALSLASSFAPQLIKYLTHSDSAGSVAGKVIDIAKQVTATTNPSTAAAAINADPALALQFQLALMTSDADLEKAHLGDVANARAMQIAALGQEDVFSKRFVYYFATAWSVFTMLYFVGVTFLTIPTSGQRVADTILGVLIATVIGVMFGYFYGSNKASRTKDDTIARMTQK